MSGTKVTNDPESFKNPTLEGAGLITSDSLAAESIRAGGDFASTTVAAISEVTAESSAASRDRDISAATVLPAAVDAEARQAQEDWGEASQLNAGRSLGRGGRGGSGAVMPPGTSAGELLAQQQKPKGQGIKEGGFDGSAPNASFNTAIGTNKDPGRVALKEIEKGNAQMASIAGPKQSAITGDGQFDALGDSSA